jgi:hypothetical protein
MLYFNDSTHDLGMNPAKSSLRALARATAQASVVSPASIQVIRRRFQSTPAFSRRFQDIEARNPRSLKGECGAMTKPRVTTADRLSNIIEVVELGRRSGLLTVERGVPPSLELGELYFNQGRAVYAMVEGLAGREALAVLAGWGHCKFAFEPNVPAPTPNVTSPHPAQPAAPARPAANGGGMGAPRIAPSSFNWNAPGARPLADPMAPPTGPGMPSTGPSGPASAPASGVSWPSAWPASAPLNNQRSTGQLNWPAAPSSQTGALPVPPAPPAASSWPSTPSQTTGPFSGSAPGAAAASASPETLQRRPRRAPDVRDLISVVSAYNLSRSHRTILLLADGEHTVLDLARLTSKSIDEVVALLASLERLGLVYYF